MSVYYIISYDIDNESEYWNYPVEVLPLFRKYGAEVIVSDSEALVMEGKTAMMNAVVRFPSKEAALNCYHDPEYQKVKQIRLKSTSNTSIVSAKEYSSD